MEERGETIVHAFLFYCNQDHIMITFEQTLVSYRCSLGFTVYRLHCGFLELFPYNALGQVCPCTSRKPKSDKLLKSLGVV